MCVVTAGSRQRKKKGESVLRPYVVATLLAHLLLLPFHQLVEARRERDAITTTTEARNTIRVVCKRTGNADLLPDSVECSEQSTLTGGLSGLLGVAAAAAAAVDEGDEDDDEGTADRAAARLRDSLNSFGALALNAGNGRAAVQGGNVEVTTEQDFERTPYGSRTTVTQIFETTDDAADTARKVIRQYDTALPLGALANGPDVSAAFSGDRGRGRPPALLTAGSDRIPDPIPHNNVRGNQKDPLLTVGDSDDLDLLSKAKGDNDEEDDVLIERISRPQNTFTYITLEDLANLEAMGFLKGNGPVRVVEGSGAGKRGAAAVAMPSVGKRGSSLPSPPKGNDHGSSHKPEQQAAAVRLIDITDSLPSSSQMLFPPTRRAARRIRRQQHRDESDKPQQQSSAPSQNKAASSISPSVAAPTAPTRKKNS